MSLLLRSLPGPGPFAAGAAPVAAAAPKTPSCIYGYTIQSSIQLAICKLDHCNPRSARRKEQPRVSCLPAVAISMGCTSSSQQVHYTSSTSSECPAMTATLPVATTAEGVEDTPAPEQEATSAVLRAARAHKWIADTMWEAADDDVTVGAGAGRPGAGRPASHPATLVLPHSNHNFDTRSVLSAASTTSYPFPRDGMSPHTPELSARGSAARQTWLGVNISPVDPQSPSMPRCALRFQHQKSLERVQFKATTSAQTYTGGRDDGDSINDGTTVSDDSDANTGTPMSFPGVRRRTSLSGTDSPSSTLPEN